MKKYYCIIVLLLAIAAGCKKAAYLMYNNGSRIQLADTATLNYTFIYKDLAVTRDTVYVKLITMGDIKDYSRTVTMEQIDEFDTTYTRDPFTGKNTDSSWKPKPYKAVPGKHYVAFTDPGVQSLLFVSADSPATRLPIILLRDTSLRSNTYRLRIRLTPNDEFGLGERKAIEKTIMFSDKLERFESWKVDNTTAAAYLTFGKYSTGKHQFMIDVLKVKIDEAWYQAALKAQATQHYKNVLRDALTAFNADPANIASGKAPVHETSDPTSPLITFPN
ncbi:MULTISPECIES: DUF4843 domain-containing protein [Niastella]|uniref:DUF4843 domain-containing protein n=1 Tax=Niastella soli TaxID=2821487 RepID=A0ABS3YYJ2_9BACT|nr:DUF4843 domain-containing protein [Niastella soli]MBO9202994.1 DUF4843 domain-containing protein [Niastella soli]